MEKSNNQIYLAICLALLLSWGCKKDKSTQKSASTMIVGQTEEIIIQELHVSMDGRLSKKFELDVNQDGIPDLEFNFNYFNLGSRTIFETQTISVMHNGIKVAALTRPDTMYYKVEPIELNSNGTSYFQITYANCRGLGDIKNYLGEVERLGAFKDGEIIAKNTQTWSQNSFEYLRSTIVDRGFNDSTYNGLPLYRVLVREPPCTDFPRGQKSFIGFLYNDIQLGFVELFVGNGVGMQLVRSGIQK
jgi:hypothetical protein